MGSASKSRQINPDTYPKPRKFSGLVVLPERDFSEDAPAAVRMNGAAWFAFCRWRDVVQEQCFQKAISFPLECSRNFSMWHPFCPGRYKGVREQRFIGLPAAQSVTVGGRFEVLSFR